MIPYYSLFSKENTSVILKTSDTNTHYYLYKYEWGKQIKIDSAFIKNREVKFKRSLQPGQYLITNSNESILNFFVNKQEKNKFIFTKTNNTLEQQAGTLENSLYLEVQNVLNNAKELFESVKELNSVLDSLYDKTLTLPKDCYLNILLGTTLQKISYNNFPWDNESFYNTQFILSSLNNYLKSIQINKIQYIIDQINSVLLANINSNNSKLKSYLAWSAFNYFATSKIMGQEEIAIYIAQNYFLNNKLTVPSNEAYVLIQNFVDFNKHSLIGMEAPNLNLQEINGNNFSITSLANIPTILFFYTDNCSICKEQTPLLLDFINEYEGGMLNVIAIYTDSNKDLWKKYVEDNFSSIYNPFINWINVYDPSYNSNFQVLYNVLSTPQMFLIDQNKTIIGRNLDAKSLEELVMIRDKRTEELSNLFENYFNGLKNSNDIEKGIDYLYSKSASDSLLLQEVTENLFNTLRFSPNYMLQQGAKYLSENYIINSSLNKYFIDVVNKWLQIYNMNPLGADAANILLETPGKSTVWLDEIISPYKVLYFYNIDCGLCEVITPKLKDLYNKFKEKGVEFVAINTGSDYEKWIKYISTNNLNWINLWGGANRSDIYKNYYLESVPAIYLLKENMVIAKDINDLDLTELLQLIK